MALATIVLCLFATVPVFAYSPEIIDLRNFSSDIQNGIEEVTWMEFEFDSSSDTGSAITIPEDENFFSDCNQYFLLVGWNGDFVTGQKYSAFFRM